MNVERQIIGSLLLDSSRIDEMRLISSEMFTDAVLSKIFSLFEHSEGKEINQLVIIPQITSDFLTEQQAVELLAEIVSEHDSGISDRSCVNRLFDEYRVRKFNEILEHTKLSPANIESTLEEYKEQIDSLQRHMRERKQEV